MSRFRPTVEVLDARTLPSAVLAGAHAPTADFSLSAGRAVQSAEQSEPADQSGEFAAKKAGGKADTSYMRITLSDVLVSSYS